MIDELSASKVTINVRETLRFFDEKPEWSTKHATSVVSVIGEDLNKACFQRYMESQGASSHVLPDPVTTGRKRGPWLDRWIVVDWPDGGKTVFQTEIKSWSAHAIGGRSLSVDATPEEVAELKQRNWGGLWNSEYRTLNHSSTAKVLAPMKLPDHLEEYSQDVRPLLIFWHLVGIQDQAWEHLFSMPNPTCKFSFEHPATWPSLSEFREFPYLWVFSVSSYLRSIPDAYIELEMPIAADRLRILGRLFGRN